MRVLIGAVAFALAACGGSGSGGSGSSGSFCSAGFVGGSSSTQGTATCNNCTINGNGQTVDGSGSTFATLQYGINGGELVVRADAPDGTTFPAGSNAGALMLFPSAASGFATVSVSFNTYRSGTPVDMSAGGNSASAGNIEGAGNDTFYSVSPSQEVDAIEAVVSLTGNSTNQAVRIYEFCGVR